jgi:hypothetical protein
MLMWNGSATPSGKETQEEDVLALSGLAIRSGVVLTVEHIAGGKKPADKYTISAGFKNWQYTDLTTLIELTHPSVAAESDLVAPSAFAAKCVLQPTGKLQGDFRCRTCRHTWKGYAHKLPNASPLRRRQRGR